MEIRRTGLVRLKGVVGNKFAAILEAVSMGDFQRCVVCQAIETQTVFNINFRAVPICQSCSRTIFLQEATWLSGLPIPQEVKERKITAANNRRRTLKRSAVQ